MIEKTEFEKAKQIIAQAEELVNLIELANSAKNRIQGIETPDSFFPDTIRLFHPMYSSGINVFLGEDSPEMHEIKAIILKVLQREYEHFLDKINEIVLNND